MRAPMSSFPVLMNQNENPLGPSPRALEAMARWSGVVHRYEPCEGLLQQRLEQQTLRIRNGNSLAVLLGSGADHLLGVACYAALAYEGGEIIEPEVSYGGASEIALKLSEQTGLPCQVVRTPMSKQLDVDLFAILDALSARTKAIFLTNPNNPTGLIIDLERIHQWLAGVPRHVIVVLDEAYIHFCTDLDAMASLSLAAHHPNVLVIRTFSKTYGLAGLRLAYGVGNQALVQRLRPWNTAEPGPFVQMAGAAALDDQAHIAHSRQLAAEFREQVRAALEPYSATILPSHTCFVLFQVGHRTSVVAEALDRQRIRVARFEHRETGEWIRVSMGTREENRYFCSTLASVLAQGLS